MGRRSMKQGFSLLELLVVIAITGLLLAMALPGFQATLRSNRLATTANQFNAAIALARSEAIKSTQAAGVCPSANGTSCSASWSDGWLIWQDADRDGNLGASETVIQYFANASQIAVTSATAAKLSFDDRGAVTPRNAANAALTSAPEIVFKTVPCPAGKPFQNTLTVRLTGQVSTQKGSCP